MGKRAKKRRRKRAAEGRPAALPPLTWWLPPGARVAGGFAEAFKESPTPILNNTPNKPWTEYRGRNNRTNP
jgi:hypothetical protein